MSTAVAQELTLADVLQQLGGISPRRVRFRPAPGTATEEDVIKIRDRERRLFELIDGVLVGEGHALAGSRSWRSSWQGTRETLSATGDCCTLAGEAGMLRLSPGLVRIPDLSFISALDWPRSIAAPRTDSSNLFDSAIEVLSEGNTPREMGAEST